MDSLSLPFIFPKGVIPRFVGSRNIKFHSPINRITEYQISFPALSDYEIWNKVSFPGLSDYGISNKCLSPVCRITEGHSSSIFLTVSSPSMSDNEASLNFNFLKKLSSTNVIPQRVWSRVVTKYDSGQSFSPVKLQYPLAESDPSFFNEFGYPIVPSHSNQIIFAVMHS